MTEITDDEVGKSVVTSGGQRVGTVTDIEGEMLYVDFTDAGVEKEQQEEFPADEIVAITDDEVVLDEHAHA